MLPPFKLGVGGPIGSGRQWLSWVHVDDVAALLLFLVESQSARRALQRHRSQPGDDARDGAHARQGPPPSRDLPVPGFALKVALGEVADVLLTGQHVVPKRALEAGFVFRFARLEDALRDLLGRKR